MPLDDGASYDPTSNTWTPLPFVGAPTARASHTAVWTGMEMLIWGGASASNNQPTWPADAAGSAPDSMQWTPLPTDGAPRPRSLHTAIWTDQEMLIWAGFAAGTPLGDGVDLQTRIRMMPPKACRSILRWSPFWWDRRRAPDGEHAERWSQPEPSVQSKSRVVLLGRSQRSDVHTELRFAVESARPRLRPAGLGPRAPTGFDGHSNISKSCAICPVHANRRPAPSGLLYAGECERVRLA